MIIYKCKSCGGSLEVSEGQTITTCEFCGTKQTTPTTNLVRNQNLHNRANSLRLKNEFDSAISTYQSIIAEDPKDYEAYWGLVLCRYGIEYVKDPKTEKRIPTCHRTLRKSIFEDFDYLKAIENADVIARSQIEKEAEEIDKIQKRILVLSNKEEPYDIFISYKESDEFGNRTKDSVKAEEIYQALTKKGYKVFFSRITLETKIGSEYEPIIFAALTSAKVMLVIGSKKEHMEATWVKNEWLRFISFMERGTHYIIPCYFEMDAYEMPEELLNYQAQNMEKIGWDQDLLRGIDKLFGEKEQKTQEINASYEVIMANSLIKKSVELIKIEEFTMSEELINQVLILDSKNSSAYFNLLLIERKIKSKEELLKTTDLVDEDINFKEALKFANKQEQEELLKISNLIKENIYQKAKKYENQRLYFDAIKILKTINKYKDAKNIIENLEAKIHELTNIHFGEYPQTVVSDSTLIEVLNNLTKTNSKGYYEYNGNEYVKLGASPYGENYKFSDNTTIGVTTYYFKMEPIKWRVISNNDGTIQLLSEYILDNQCYHLDTENRTIDGEIIYANNYEHSYIREWLNNDFYNKAFGIFVQDAILTVLVNSASNNANDKIYLLSYQDATNSSYGFTTSTSSSNTRYAITTDYARAKGAYISTENSYYGNGYWWLRSPYGGSYYSSSSINYDGSINNDIVSSAGGGIRPVLQIKQRL